MNRLSLFVGRGVRSCGRGVVRMLPLFALIVAMTVSNYAAATPDPLELPDLGVEDAITEYVPLLITAIGASILLALGGFFAIIGFKVGIQWIRSLVTGKA